ncbi:MAG: hypothetical protein P8H99_05115, partial [Luminiphilus sp.]|nr:hypothetical protein [Luminiphilus sp.]
VLYCSSVVNLSGVAAPDSRLETAYTGARSAAKGAVDSSATPLPRGNSERLSSQTVSIRSE